MVHEHVRYLRFLQCNYIIIGLEALLATTDHLKILQRHWVDCV